MTSLTTQSDAKELAFRATDGVEVTLLWHQRDDFVSVTVFDSKTGDRFELVLGDDDSPMESSTTRMPMPPSAGSTSSFPHATTSSRPPEIYRPVSERAR